MPRLFSVIDQSFFEMTKQITVIQFGHNVRQCVLTLFWDKWPRYLNERKTQVNATLIDSQQRHTPFVQAGAETSNTVKEAVKPDPHCSWQGHSRRVGADVGDGSTEPCSVVIVQPLRITSVIRPEHHTYVVVVVRWTDELLCGGYKWEWVSRFETPCIPTQWAGERWVEQMSRLHGTAC